MSQSIAYSTLNDQSSSISGQSATSVSNILWLNETLPSFMTKDFALAPFGPVKNSSRFIAGSFETWTGTTTLYGVNTTCEQPIQWVDSNNFTNYNSSWGCQLLAPPPQTVGYGTDNSRPFLSLYVGYGNADGSALYSIDEQNCALETNSFFIQHVQSLVPLSDLRQMAAAQAFLHTNITSRWCRAKYYMQQVRATVSLPNHEVLSYAATNNPKDVPLDMFNVTDFEAAMNIGKERNPIRTLFPTPNWPDQTAFLFGMSLNLDTLPPMVPFAIGTTQQAAQDYLNGSLLEESYQSAYRTLFARQITNILSHDLDNESESTGLQQITTQAIIIVPVFAYIAQGLLGLIILLSLWLIAFSISRTLNLTYDPSTIEGLMRLTADSISLLDRFKDLDRASNEELAKLFDDHKFKLEVAPHSQNPQLKALQLGNVEDLASEFSALAKNQIDLHVAGQQPHELKLRVGIMFLVFLVSLIITMVILFWRSLQNNGVS
jgi:hypothetical protein